MSIELKDVSYAYRGADGRDIAALRPTSVTVEPGEFVAIIGANGSGKTTLAKLMNGLLFTISGSVQIDGRTVSPHHNDLFARRTVGMVFQNPDNQIVATIVEDDVAFGPENLGIETDEIRTRVDEALAKVGMLGHARSDPHNLSAGQRQRIAIAGVLAMRPSYMVLDEPTSFLDPRSRGDVHEVLDDLRAEESLGIVYVTHMIEEVVAADKVLVVSEGSVIGSGSPREILTNEQLMADSGLYSPKPNRLARRLAANSIEISEDLLTGEEVAEALC